LPDYYDQHAAFFIETTRDVDMSEPRGRFLAAIPSRLGGAARILDAGSGSGRDALAFRHLGHDVQAFDASPAMVAATRTHAAVPTRQMQFQDFAWEHPFEGIWACASLLHVAEVDLPRVIDRLAAHLVPGGALYLSFKHGTGARVKDGRCWSCRECCGNSLAACSGHVKVRFLRRPGQGASAQWAERGFPSHRPCASGSVRRRAAPRATSARSRRRAARSGS
jgi:SAM-dependent methyltransferase